MFSPQSNVFGKGNCFRWNAICPNLHKTLLYHLVYNLHLIHLEMYKAIEIDQPKTFR